MVGRILAVVLYEISESKTPDIMFTKPKGKNKGFNLNVDKLNGEDSFDEDDDDEIDEFDDDDNNNGNEGGIASKFKGFYKK